MKDFQTGASVRNLIAVTLSLLFVAQAARADAAADVEAAAHAYTIDVPKKLALKVGETAQLKLVVVPTKGDHVSPDAPVSLTAAPSAQFDLPKPKLSRADSHPTVAEGVEFSMPVKGLAKGQSELKANLTFYICVATLCAHQKRELIVPVQVE
jgi:hypothetical protein